MDIFKFIKSKDVKQYLKDIKYEFSSLNCAYIVWASEMPLKTKLKAWREIIDKLPDCQIPTSNFYEEISLHKHLSELLDCYAFLLKQFYRESIGAFSYRYCDFLNGIDKKSEELLDSYSSAFDMARSDIEQCNAEVNNQLYIKKNCSDLGCVLSLRTNIKGQVLDLYLSGTLEGKIKEYDDILIMLGCGHEKLPTPFKEGDILCTPHYTCYRQFVLSNYDRFEGYAIIGNDITNFRPAFVNFHDLEYVRNHIVNKRLQLISDYLKHKINISELLFRFKKDFLERDN